MASTGPQAIHTVGGAVLAGGSSRRMGRDKAFIRVDGVTLMERAVAALESGGVSPVVVVGGDIDRIGRLGLGPVPDRYPGTGPLGGVLTALGHLTTSVVVVIACDHIDPRPEAIRATIDALGSADVAVPVSAGREQWLHSAWRRDALAKVEQAFADGCRAPRELVDRLSVSWFVDGDPGWYRDADRPDDLGDDPH